MPIRKIISRSIGTDVIAAEDLAANSVTVAEIQDGAVTEAKIGSGAVTGAKIGDTEVSAGKLASTLDLSSNTVTLPDESVTADKLDVGQIGGRRNLIINGAMQVAQRGTSAVTLSNAESFGVDRFVARNQSNSGDNTIQQVSDAPAGVGSHSLKWTTGTSDTAGSTDNNYISQKIEGANLAHLKWGTSDALTVTLSFYVKSSLTGNFGGSFTNDDLSRNYPFSFSISSADTWERKEITVTGDTTGTWGVTSSDRLWLFFDLGMGSTYRGTAGAWTATRAQGVTGSVDVIGTAGATFQITGVQLEVGTVATPHEHISYGEQLTLCQRYYYLHIKGSGYWATAFYYSSSFARWQVPFTVPMRTTPAVEFDVGSAGDFGLYRDGGQDVFTAITLDGYDGNSNQPQIFMFNNSEMSGTAGQTGAIYAKSADTYLALNAEL